MSTSKHIELIEWTHNAGEGGREEEPDVVVASAKCGDGGKGNARVEMKDIEKDYVVWNVFVVCNLEHIFRIRKYILDWIICNTILKISFDSKLMNNLVLIYIYRGVGKNCGGSKKNIY